MVGGGAVGSKWGGWEGGMHSWPRRRREVHGGGSVKFAMKCDTGGGGVAVGWGVMVVEHARLAKEKALVNFTEVGTLL